MVLDFISVGEVVTVHYVGGDRIRYDLVISILLRQMGSHHIMKVEDVITVDSRDVR